MENWREGVMTKITPVRGALLIARLTLPWVPSGLRAFVLPFLVFQMLSRFKSSQVISFGVNSTSNAAMF